MKPNERNRILQLLLHYKSSQWGSTSSVQHIHMTENYVKPIARALRELDKYQYPLDHYMWLAWEGLIEYVPDNIKPTPQEVSNWIQKSQIVIQNNNIPCQ
ncbi:hypothetical protein [Aquimarina sediminis]|uniref:hypothetical protein n=1 Tax=Aquimarina sediminis TaxID=2070536 RepID=UPI000CA08F83|nr:hypothetical protein [Aquimarina sediminis]